MKFNLPVPTPLEHVNDLLGIPWIRLTILAMLQIQTDCILTLPHPMLNVSCFVTKATYLHIIQFLASSIEKHTPLRSVV